MVAPLIGRLKRKLRQWKGRLRRRAEVRAANEAVEAARPRSCGYDVVCLPVMPWRSRVQRPQQLMWQFAEHGHRVFYASLAFRAGAAAAIEAVAPGIFETTLPGTPGANVYQQLPTDADVEQMAAALDRLRIDHRVTSAVVVVQLPFWTALAETLRRRFGWPIVYDCMDDHSGFSTNCQTMLDAEDRIVAEADLVVVTADVLRQKVGPKARRTALVRNACEYEHFAPLPKGEGQEVRNADASGNSNCNLQNETCKLSASNPQSLIPNPSSAGPHPNPLPKGEGTEVGGPHPGPLPRGEGTMAAAPIIGFYGAIAEWFDADLVADLAELRPSWKFELIGSTHTGDVSRLKKLRNVTLLGEQPYAELPRLTAGWDCHVIPFKRIPLTEATNPVKAYEMLATGKPVVAVDLPELRPMAEQKLLTLAHDGRGFAEAIGRSLSDDDAERRQRRLAFAAANTWQRRWQDLDAAVRELFPLVSIVTATFNNLPLNKAWLHSIVQETDYPNYEVIAVDNGSSDGTAEWLIEQGAEKGDSPHLPERPEGCFAQMGTVPFFQPRMKVICNRENRGFAAANNQALREARGEFLCLLNNDTLVTRGWLSTLIGHLQRTPGLGLVGPVSNSVGNAAQVAVGYRNLAELPGWAETYCRQHDGEKAPLEMLGFFCVAMPREVYRRIGELDERFGLGCFEDDDYCRRVREAGFGLCFVRDAFVHHWKEASFRLLGEDVYLRTYYENQSRFEAKWT
jgi:GT2 family glycosyltransferase/glycosyltransferase involved in cell wall biosynthesis